MRKLTLDDYKRLYSNAKKEIEYLKDVIENFKSIQRGKCCDCCEDAVQDYSDLMIKCMPFDDECFKGLSYEMIAQLAKKSLRLTSDNCKMRHAIEDSYEILCNYPQDDRISQCIKLLGECSICIDK